MKLSFLNLSRLLLAIFLVTFPFQIGTIIYTATTFSTGEFNYFTTFFASASDLILLLSFLLWGISCFQHEQNAKFSFGDNKITLLLVLFLFSGFLSVFFAGDKLLALFFSFRFLELFLFYLMVVNEILPTNKMILCFVVGMSFQSVLAILQYLIQGSVGLHFLGEPIAGAQTLGVAKIDIAGIKILRSFGTFSHANVLGGALFVAVVLSFKAFAERMKFGVPVICLLFAGLVLSFSRSAFMALVLACLIFFVFYGRKISKKVFVVGSALLVFFLVVFNVGAVFFQRFLFEDLQSSQERLMYLQMSFEMFKNYPFGVGLGGFTEFMGFLSTIKLTPWLYQPVHNIFLLVTNESGFLGGSIFLLIFIVSFLKLIAFKSKSNSKKEELEKILYLGLLVGITLIGLIDHYFITIYQGQVLLFFYFGLVSSFVSKSLLPRKNS